MSLIFFSNFSNFIALFGLCGNFLDLFHTSHMCREFWGPDAPSLAQAILWRTPPKFSEQSSYQPSYNAVPSVPSCVSVTFLTARHIPGCLVPYWSVGILNNQHHLNRSAPSCYFAHSWSLGAFIVSKGSRLFGALLVTRCSLACSVPFLHDTFPVTWHPHNLSAPPWLHLTFSWPLCVLLTVRCPRRCSMSSNRDVSIPTHLCPALLSVLLSCVLGHASASQFHLSVT